MRLIATVGGAKLDIGLEENGHLRRVTLDGRDAAVDWRRVGSSPSMPTPERAAHYSLLVGDSSYDLFIRAVPSSEAGGGAAFEVSLDGRTYLVGVQDERTQALAGLAGEGHLSGDTAIRAPMPGLIAGIVVAEGARVERGQPVIVLEAMKMENDLPAPRSGLVKSIKVGKGQTVNQNDVLAIVGDAPGTAAAPDPDEL